MTLAVERPSGWRTLLASDAGKWHLFLVGVTAASLLPFLGIPFARHVVPDAKLGFYYFAVLNFLGGQLHVAATGWFYTDPTMRSFFRERPIRYLVVPALLIVGGALGLQYIDRTVGRYLVVLYFWWQLWHYQKQNVGLLSFIAAGTDKISISPWERRTLGVAAAAGILGFCRVYEVGLPQRAAEFAWLWRAGIAVYCLVPIAFAIALAKNPALRRNPLRLAFFALGAGFFLPTFLFSDTPSAVFSFALAHGLQYLVFMSFVSVGKRNAILSFVALAAIAVGGYFLLTRAMTAEDWMTSPYKYALGGAFLGVVMSHFVIDAGLWRLREPFQRGYMREKFGFVFSRPRTEA